MSGMPLSDSRRARSQRGAVLYVALIMLILLALLGIVGLQVAGIQERMASSYRAVNRSFQKAEEATREAECAVESIANRTDPGDCTIVASADIVMGCDQRFEPMDWAETQSTSFANAPAVSVRQIDTCIQGESELGMGTEPVSENAFPIYQITSYAVDDTDNPNSSSVVDTIFKL